MSKTPKKPSEWRPDVDARLEVICLKMMAKRITNRFASMGEVVQTLTNYLKSSPKSGEHAAMVSVGTSVSGKTREPKRHKVSARDVADLLELSQEFMEKRDYAQVIQLLESIPPRVRTNAVLELLEGATELQDELTWLISDLKDAVLKHEYEGLLPNVERLLELRPGHEKAQKVYEQLTGKSLSGGSGRRAKRMRGFAARSGSRRINSDSWITTSIAMMIAVGVVAFGLMTWGVTIYLRSDGQTVIVEIDDSVRADDVSVSIDGDQTDIAGIGETITLKRGDHVLEIKRGDVIAKTQDFQIVKGEKTVLRISLADERIAGQPADDVTGTSATGTGGTGERTPTFAIAPFTAAEAKQHQAVWAEYLGVPVEMTNSIDMKLTLIPAGEFLMGSPESEVDRSDDEGPQHRVRITKPFYLGQTEVTQGQWQTVMGTQPWKGKRFAKEGADNAASYVSWEDAQEFCRRLSQKEGVSYRLPAEAEWEYACRAGTTTKYCFSDNASRLGDYAWYAGNAESVGESYAHQVGTKQSNPFGLYDLPGNVSEWCQDWYSSGYDVTLDVDDPTGSGQGSNWVLRGGGWVAPRSAAGRRPGTGTRRTPGTAAWAFGSPAVQAAEPSQEEASGAGSEG